MAFPSASGTVDSCRPRCGRRPRTPGACRCILPLLRLAISAREPPVRLAADARARYGTAGCGFGFGYGRAGEDISGFARGCVRDGGGAAGCGFGYGSDRRRNCRIRNDDGIDYACLALGRSCGLRCSSRRDWPLARTGARAC